jgi:hypothetical protein
MKPMATTTPKCLWTVMDEGPMDSASSALDGSLGLPFQENRY